MKVKKAEPALSNEKGAFYATLDVASVCANLFDTAALECVSPLCASRRLASANGYCHKNRAPRNDSLIKRGTVEM